MNRNGGGRARVVAAAVFILAGVASAADRSAPVRTDQAGRPAVTPASVPDALRNSWPAELEREFQTRADAILRAQAAGKMPGGNTYFENEKRSYGLLMAHALAGNRREALKHLQAEDAQAKEWHRETAGIDFYACFTLKHQVRKYFYFGPQLDPAYRQRMFDGARRWTERDPLRRPHYAFKQRGPGWGPDVMNSWVDVRSTENLFLMRNAAVYLFAEETGNEATRQTYKRILLNYAAALYRVGMGEWDSENYHGHSIAPLLGLYDFAKDAEVRAAAKACLDFVAATGAVKYWRGGFNGPTKRDYNHTQPFGGSAASMLWVWFGDAPEVEHAWESDEVHALTSAYRPPLAVVNLARKEFTRPVEVLASKAHYEATTRNELDRGPRHLETHYFGETFQFGSLIDGTSPGTTDVNGFKVLAFDSKLGVTALQCVPGPDPAFVGSARYVEGKVHGPNWVGQNRNAAIWLVRGGDAPWVWLVPETVGVEVAEGVTFMRAERTWVALRPINLAAPFTVDEKLTADVVRSELGTGHQVVSARGTGGAYCGFAIEIGEGVAYDTFKRAVLDKARLDASQAADGTVSFVASDGRGVGLKVSGVAAEVTKDGKTHDQAAHARLLFGGDHSPIRHEWLGGTLTVEAGGARFSCTVSRDGLVTFAR